MGYYGFYFALHCSYRAVTPNKPESQTKSLDLESQFSDQSETQTKISDSDQGNKFLDLCDIAPSENLRPNLRILDFESQTKNSDLSETQTEILDMDSEILDQVKTYLFNNYSKNERVKKFQDEFCLSLTDYRKTLEQLKKDGILYTENRNTYMAVEKTKEGIINE